MQPNNPVSTIMTRQLQTVLPDEFLHQVTNIFDRNNFHHIPVVKEGSQLVGIISREDFQKMNLYFFLKTTKENGMAGKEEGLRAIDIMTPSPVSIDPDDSIGLAADIFLANRFHALPVVEDGELVGIVTSHDLIKYAFTSVLEPTANQVL